MVKVMATGVFDLLHLGHLHFLQAAKALGDELIVVVANDSTVESQKHKPVTPQEMRAELISALKPVDTVIIGHEGDPFEVVEEIRPDIIALGYDQHHNEEDIRRELASRGLPTEVVRLGKFDGDLDGTRKIIWRILDNWDDLYAANRDS